MLKNKNVGRETTKEKEVKIEDKVKIINSSEKGRGDNVSF